MKDLNEVETESLRWQQSGRTESELLADGEQRGEGKKSELRNGAKSGAIAGLVSGAIIGTAEYFVVSFYKVVIEASLQSTLPSNSPFTADQLVTILQISIPLLSIMAGTFGGVILGMVFAKTYRRFLTSRSVPFRGLLVGVLLFLLDIALNSTNIFAYGTEYAGANVAVLLFPNLVFGYLMGALLARWTP